MSSAEIEYLLDANVVINFQRSGQLQALADTTLNLAMVEEVWDELTAPRGGKHGAYAAEVESKLAKKVRVASIPVGSDEASTLSALRAGNSSQSNRGEDASTALAMFDRNLVLVTDEQRAAYRGLNELRGRVIVAHPFMRLMVEHGGLDVTAARFIADELRATSRSTCPTWWDVWIETLLDGASEK